MGWRIGEQPVIQYLRLHRVLAQGNFVLAVSEGTRAGAHTAFYDLYRVEDGALLVEHWDTVEAVPPVSEWKNDSSTSRASTSSHPTRPPRPMMGDLDSCHEHLPRPWVYLVASTKVEAAGVEFDALGSYNNSDRSGLLASSLGVLGSASGRGRGR